MRVSHQSATTLLALTLLLAPTAASAQTPDVPRTPWGTPDLNGVWDFRTLTPLERPEEYGDREFLTEEEARAIGAEWRHRLRPTPGGRHGGRARGKRGSRFPGRPA